MKIFFFAIILLFSNSASAEVAVGESLDWLGVSRLEIGEYKLLEAKDRANPGARWIQRHYLLKRKSSLKGAPEKRIRLERSVPLKTPKPASGRRYLIFFDHNGKTDYVIDLKRPGDTASWERAFTNDFREIKGRRKILRALKNRLAYHEDTTWPKVDTQRYVNGRPGSGYIKLEVPHNSHAHDRLYNGSAVYLVIPADEDRAPELLDQARDPEIAVRARAAWRLANYHTTESERLLRTLLKDPGTNMLTTNSKQHVVYPVRQAAYQALRAMGVMVDRPKGYDKHYPLSFLE